MRSKSHEAKLLNEKKISLIFVQYAHCNLPVFGYNAHSQETGKKEIKTMINTNKRTFSQKIRDFIEDGVFAFAMAYAKGNVETVRALEEKLR